MIGWLDIAVNIIVLAVCDLFLEYVLCVAHKETVL